MPDFPTSSSVGPAAPQEGTEETAGASRGAVAEQTFSEMMVRYPGVPNEQVVSVPSRPEGRGPTGTHWPGYDDAESASKNPRPILPRHPLNARLPTNEGDPADTQLRWVTNNEELTSAQDQSLFNGFKFRDPDIADGAANLLLLPNVRNNPHRSVTDDPENSVERAQVSLRVPGQAHLQPGLTVEGVHEGVDDPAELSHPWARTDGHTHVPMTGGYDQFRPSPDDQLTARHNPNVRSFIKVPNYHKAPDHEIVQYSGAMPLRHYVSLPNPDGRPVPPDSPDHYSPNGTSLEMPAFKELPVDHVGLTRPPGPTDEHSLSGSEAEEVDPMSDDEHFGGIGRA